MPKGLGRNPRPFSVSEFILWKCAPKGNQRRLIPIDKHSQAWIIRRLPLNAHFLIIHSKIGLRFPGHHRMDLEVLHDEFGHIHVDLPDDLGW